jgi:glycosyltransferase involved in cell wall biosynthesis
MRLLHLVHQYLPDDIGGTELYTQWLAEGLRAQGHEVSVFYRRSGPDETTTQRVEPSGTQVWAVTAGRVTPQRRFLATFNQPSILNAFQQAIAVVQPDLVHIQHLMGLPVSLAHHLQQQNIPYLITLHDYWWVCANAQLLTNYSQQLCDGPRAYLNCARCALARANHPRLWPAIPGLAALLARRNHLLRGVLRAAQRLIAPSQFVADWYAAHGAPLRTLQVIPHGLPLLPPSQSRVQGDAGRPFRFGYISGGLTPQKGIHILVEAARQLPAAIELWVAGDEGADPDYAARLRAAASTETRFLGRLSRRQVWDMLAQIDVLVVPSLWYETFAFVISEAFAAGVPVIASNLGPLAGRVQHEGDGLLVPPDDAAALRQALQRFLEEPDLLDRLRAGIQAVQTMEGHAKALEAVYQLVVVGENNLCQT